MAPVCRVWVLLRAAAARYRGLKCLMFKLPGAIFNISSDPHCWSSPSSQWSGWYLVRGSFTRRGGRRESTTATSVKHREGGGGEVACNIATIRIRNKDQGQQQDLDQDRKISGSDDDDDATVTRELGGAWYVEPLLRCRAKQLVSQIVLADGEFVSAFLDS